MKHLLPLLIAAELCLYLLTSCSVTDPLGATTRTQIQANSAVRVAEAQAQAQIESARYSAEAQQATARTWANTLPLLLLILVGGVLIGIVCYFRGRAYLLWLERSLYPPPPLSPTIYARRLADYARRTGQQLEIVNGQYYLVDQQSGRRFKALPKH